MILSISYFRIFQHSSAVLYSSACYSNLALLSIFSYLYSCYLCGSFSYTFFYFYFLILHWCQNVFDCGHCYPMVHVFLHCPLIVCDDKTIYNTFSPLVGSSTCWVRKLSWVKNKNCWSSPPVLSRDFHCMWPWLKSPIMIHSPLLTSFIAFCIFVLSSSFMFVLR